MGADESTADDGVENDKMMRNLGYMKAPESCWYAHDNIPLRDWYKALRYIVNQYSFQDYGAISCVCVVWISQVVNFPLTISSLSRWI